MKERKIEGYWKDGPKSKLPMPVPTDGWTGRKAWLDKLGKVEAVSREVPYKGRSICRICHKNNGNSEFSYKNWVWPGGYAHYIREHRIKPSLAFKKFIEEQHDKLA